MANQEPIELAFTELAAVIREKDESGLSFAEYLDKLKDLAAQAARKLEIAEAAKDMCSETKSRRPRSDKGKPRKKSDEQPEVS